MGSPCGDKRERSDCDYSKAHEDLPQNLAAPQIGQFPGGSQFGPLTQHPGCPAAHQVPARQLAVAEE